MKKQLILLAIILLPMIAHADAVEIDGIYYNLVTKGNVAEVTSNPNYYSGNVVIPEKIEYEGTEYDVASIGVRAFIGCRNLTSITIPNSVTSIGEWAISQCTALTSITIPNSVTIIKIGAFADCSGLTSIMIPNSVTRIGESAFASCTALTSISIPNSVTSIGREAFSGCTTLTSITIPNSVTSIEVGTFERCNSLTSITIPNSVKSIGAWAFQLCTSLTSVRIGNSVTGIGGSAFESCSNLTSVNIPNRVTYIGEKAFNGCASLTSIKIPNSVTYIGEWAFSYCGSLTSITIPNSVTFLGKGAFIGCNGLITIKIGNGIKDIYSNSFAYCPELKDVYCYSENVPNTEIDTFDYSYIEYATLHVPDASINLYKAKEPWKNFKEIVGLNGTTQETNKCEKPTINYKNGQLKFESATEGAEFVTDITDADIKKHYSASISLTATYNISVYATKAGYENSEAATATLCWIDQEPKTEGVNTDGIANIPANAVLIQTSGSMLTVQGADDGTPVSVYSTDGTQAGSAVSRNGQAEINTNLQPGAVAIVKIGEKSVKVVLK